MDLAKLDNERKAAMLIVLLGEEASERMFAHLSKREIAKLAREIAELGPIEPEIGNAVLEEYYMRAVKAPKAQGGPDMARRLLASANIAEDLVDQLVHETNYSDEVLGPLLEAPPAMLAEALADEHPQTMALVLLQLPPARAGALLAALPDEKRCETVLRMADVRQVGDEIIDEVAASLSERLGKSKGSGEEDGILRTAGVLGAMQRKITKAILDELEADHPDHAAQLRDNLYTFDSLIDVDEKGIQELLRAVDNQQIALALDDVEEELEQLFMNNLSERAASRLKEEMELNTKATKADKEAAQKEILTIAMQLEADGKLSFAEPESDDE